MLIAQPDGCPISSQPRWPEDISLLICTVSALNNSMQRGRDLCGRNQLSGRVIPRFNNRKQHDHSRLLVRAHAKEIVVDQSLRFALQAGIDKLADTVGVTLGPREDVSGEALVILVVNKLRGILKVATVKAPSFGEQRKSWLQAIATVTGAEFVASNLGLKAENASVDMPGHARRVRVTITSNSCTDAATKDKIQARIAQLKKELAKTDSVYDTEKLSDRIAKLLSGIAVIKVSVATTKTKLGDHKLRIEDAKYATFVAINHEEGDLQLEEKTQVKYI
ncbi:hypothetical protein L7F22_064689 [Adiantum nelumboides]|nr:hypothetical protein [Adiantum nelumboides]